MCGLGAPIVYGVLPGSLENCLSTQHLYKQRPLPVNKEPQPVEGGISSLGG